MGDRDGVGVQETKCPHRTTATKVPATLRQRALQIASQKTKRMCSRLWSRDSHAASGEDYSEADCLPAAHGKSHIRVGTYSLKLQPIKKPCWSCIILKGSSAWKRSRWKSLRKKKHRRGAVRD